MVVIVHLAAEKINNKQNTTKNCRNMKITLFTPSDFKNYNKPHGTRINEKTINSSTMATESYKENIRKLTSYIHQIERENKKGMKAIRLFCLMQITP
jgi:hypothetical protein